MPFSLRSYRCLPLTYSLGFWLLITLLFLSSGPAYAEWVSIGKTESSETMIYVDPDTIRHKGNLVKMWKPYDFKTIQTVDGVSYFSSKAQSEYDCAEERHRELMYTWFTSSMGRGKVVFSDLYEGRWEPIAPESIAQLLWTFACSKQ